MDWKRKRDQNEDESIEGTGLHLPILLKTCLFPIGEPGTGALCLLEWTVCWVVGRFKRGLN